MNHKLIYSKKMLIKNKLRNLHYYITVDTSSVLEEDSCLYGIEVDINESETYVSPHYFDTYHHAETVLSTLAKYKVTPVICADVVEDLLKKH